MAQNPYIDPVSHEVFDHVEKQQTRQQWFCWQVHVDVQSFSEQTQGKGKGYKKDNGQQIFVNSHKGQDSK